MKSVCPQIRCILLLLAFLSFCGTTQSQHCKVLVQVIPDFCDPSFTCLTLNAVPYGFNSTPPYTYLWSTGATTETICVPNQFGNYSVSVTDANGCVAIAFLSIPAPITAYAWLNQTCTNCCPGDVMNLGIVWTFNEPPGFTYLWSTGETTPGILTTVPGTYTLTITDPTTGCTLVLSDVLAYPPTPDPNILGPMTLCSGQTVTLSVSGGPYNGYQWLPGGQYTPTIEVSEPGTYVVIVSQNGFNCAGIDTLIIEPGSGNIPPPQLSGPAILCPGQTGIISVINESDYTGFDWNTGESTADISISDPGTYTVTVTNTGGCTASASITVDPGSSNLDITGTTSPETSCTNPNGSIDISVNPQGPYSYDWSNGSGTQDISDLPSGTYSVTVTDAGGCTSTAVYVVDLILLLPDINSTTTPTSCDLSNGGIDLTVTPTGDYTFLWSNGTTSEDLTNISPGTYSVTVTSSVNGCTVNETLTVSNINPPIDISGNTSPLTSCITPNGAIDISISPAGTYAYLWSNGANTQNLDTLPAGTYTVTVTLGVSCTQNATFVVPDNTLPIVLTGISTPNTSCTQANGTVDLSVNPAGTYTFLWSNGNTTEDLNQLTGGTYSVTVTASDGCTATSMLDVVNTNSNYTFAGIVSPNNSCVSPNGNVNLTLNPVGTYSFLWSNGAMTEDVNLLPAGTYGVTVSDINNCTSVATYSVADSIVNPSITALLSPETCVNQNGAVDLSIVPVSGNTFSWSNGFMTEDVSGLSAGPYTVTVTASNGCFAVDSFIIATQNSNFTLTDVISPNTHCLIPNGAIDLSVLPAGAYTFNWSNTATTEDISGLPSGSYSVTVTDTANCASIDTFLIQNISSPPLLSSTIIPANCGANDGAIDLMVSPSINTSVLWSNGSTNEDLQNILPGSYSVIVSDTISGCQAFDTIIVQNINNNFSTSALPSANTSCVSPNGSIALSVMPTGIYTFSWSNGAITEDLTNLSSGAYTVTITDITSCSSIETFLIFDNLPFVLITPAVTPSTCGLNNGAIDLSINPSAGNTFSWSNGAITEDLQNLSPGDFIVTVTGAGGCQAIDTFSVPGQGTVPALSGLSTANTNCLNTNGAIDLSVSPAGTYTYLWSNGIVTQDQASLSPGIYTVTVSDSFGCSASSSFTIDDQTTLPVINVSVTPAMCGNNNGQINITVSPSATYAFSWSNGAVSEDLLTASPGMYSVTVTGANGCAADTLVEVMNTGLSFSVSGTTTDHTSCTTWNGAIEITITPAGSYTFLWSGGQNSEDVTAVEPGVYVVTVTDMAGCSTSAQFTVDNNVVPITTAEVISPVLCGEPNGAIELTITPSSGNTFAWSNGSTTEDIDQLMTGPYQVTITAQNGCNTSLAFVVPGSQGVQLTLEANASSSGPDFITITVQLNVSPATIDTIIWLPENLFDCNNAICLEQTISRPDTKTEIKVIAFDTNGCMAQEILLLDAISDPKVYIPNVFSPNGDGINDWFTVYGNNDVQLILELQIFDRWGNNVFINNEFPPNEENYGWDGGFKNAEMNPAVFAYWAHVLFTDGSDKFYKGDITLVR